MTDKPFGVSVLLLCALAVALVMAGVWAWAVWKDKGKR